MGITSIIEPTYITMGSRREFSPSDVAGLKLWLKADAGTWQDAALSVAAAADGDVVGGWVGQEAAANTFIQATTSKKPILKTGVNGINGLPVIRGDGVDDILVRAAQTFTGSTGTVLAVVRMTAPFAGGLFLGQADITSTNNSFGFWLRGPTKKLVTGVAAPNFIEGATVLVAGTPYLVTNESDGVQYFMYINGIIDTPYTITAGANDGAWWAADSSIDYTTVFAQKEMTIENIFLKGDIGEIVVVEPRLSSTAFANLVSYALARWGL